MSDADYLTGIQRIGVDARRHLHRVTVHRLAHCVLYRRTRLLLLQTVVIRVVTRRRHRYIACARCRTDDGRHHAGGGIIDPGNVGDGDAGRQPAGDAGSESDVDRAIAGHITGPGDSTRGGYVLAAAGGVGQQIGVAHVGVQCVGDRYALDGGTASIGQDDGVGEGLARRGCGWSDRLGAHQPVLISAGVIAAQQRAWIAISVVNWLGRVRVASVDGRGIAPQVEIATGSIHETRRRGDGLAAGDYVVEIGRAVYPHQVVGQGRRTASVIDTVLGVLGDDSVADHW